MWHKRKAHLNIFSIVSIISGMLILMPLLGILFKLTSPATPEWNHIKTYLLSEYIYNTIILVLLVATFSLIIGLFAAYVIARYQFKGRNILAWLLVLPLAIPSYILGYIYADMTSYTGTISDALRAIGVTQDLSIMNIFGASIIFSLTLYPYIYILSLSSLARQSANYIDSAKLLGSSRIHTFFTITLPLLRPALVSGSLLVILETLNDYGLVHYFNIRVFSFAIFNAWFSLGDVVSAIRLSAFLMLTVFLIILLEKALRGKKKYHMPTKSRFIRREQVRGGKLVIIYVGLSLILLFSFLLPIAQMIEYLTLTIHKTWHSKLWIVTLQTVTNGLIATMIILMIAIFMVNFNRMKRKNRWSRYFTKVSNLGYAIPGAVIAIAVHLFFVDLDRFLSPLYRFINSESPTLLITMSLLTLILAYVLRFLSIGFNSVESQYEKIGDRFTESSYMLGSSKLATLFRIDIPMIYPGLISALILVFIDVIKELPLTLILRPINYDSLATYVYVYTSNEMIQEASLPSLILILISTVLIYVITHFKKGVFSHVY